MEQDRDESDVLALAGLAALGGAWGLAKKVRAAKAAKATAESVRVMDEVRAFAANGDYATARIRIMAALKRWPGDPVFLLAAGQISLELSHYREAAQHCAAAAAAVNRALPGADNLLCAALVGLGAARYYLGEYEGSWAAHSAAHQVSPTSPYPLVNLAILAAVQKRFDVMRHLLERAIPLIHPQDRLVERLTSEEAFAEHLDDVLNLLLAHHRLSPREYTRLLNAWQKGTLQLQRQDVYVNVSGTVGAFSVGSNSPVSDATVDKG